MEETNCAASSKSLQLVYSSCNDPKDFAFHYGQYIFGIGLSWRRTEITAESVSRRYTLVFREDPSPMLHGVPSARVALLRSYKYVCKYVASSCRCNGAGSCNSSLAQPPRTRPDRHLRRLSRRRLTNWLLNYWATWPVIASYLTSPGYIGSWILRFEEYTCLFSDSLILSSSLSCLHLPLSLSFFLFLLLPLFTDFSPFSLKSETNVAYFFVYINDNQQCVVIVKS